LDGAALTLDKRRILYLPVETKARELAGKTFLAARAVARGWIVVLGARPETLKFMENSPTGAYIEISIPESKTALLERLSKSGHLLFNLCEESLNYLSGRYYSFQMLGLGPRPWIEKLLVLGQMNANHIRAFRPEFMDKISVTGNPRFDTLLPRMRHVYEKRAEFIRRHYGRFILVNTNFGSVNGFKLPVGKLELMKRRGMIIDQEHADFISRKVEYESRKIHGLRTLLTQVAKSGAVRRIVIRPHPAEDHEAVRRWARPLNIDVVIEGTANEWMLAADAVLHPSCTTGIEGLLLDRPVFSYVPERDNEFLCLSDRVSRQIASADEFIGQLAEVRDLTQEEVRRRFADQRSEIDSYIANTNLPLATDRILDELEQLDLPAVPISHLGVSNWSLLSGMRARMHNWSMKDPPRPGARNLQKLPAISLPELRASLDQWIEAGILTEMPRITPFNNRLCVWH
jgi:surface carbohydrate biosynthesis protein